MEAQVSLRGKRRIPQLTARLYLAGRAMFILRRQCYGQIVFIEVFLSFCFSFFRSEVSATFSQRATRRLHEVKREIASQPIFQRNFQQFS